MEETQKNKFELNKEGANLPVVSYSRLTTYKNCPKGYKFAYIDKLPRLDKPFTVFGQFCHEILENFHLLYIEEQKKINQEQRKLALIMKEAFDSARKNWNEKCTKEQMVEAFQIMQQYLDVLYTTKVPNVVGIEKEIWLPIDDTLILYGFIDRIQVDDDGIIHIVDYKTTKDPSFLKDRLQLQLYAYSMYKENPEIEKVRSSFILLKHKMKPMIAEDNIETLIAAKDKLLSMWQMILDDKLFRATPLGYKCKNCDYIEHCKEGKNLLQKTSKAGLKPGKTSW